MHKKTLHTKFAWFCSISQQTSRLRDTASPAVNTVNGPVKRRHTTHPVTVSV